MDELHSMLRSLRTEQKSDKHHLSVFREFLAQLGELQRKAVAKPRPKAPPRRKPPRRAKTG